MIGALNRWERQGKHDVDHPQQGSVRMGKGPHEAARLVGHVQIGADLETVQRFQRQPERREHKNRPPPEPQVPPGQGPCLSRDLFFSSQCAEL